MSFPKQVLSVLLVAIAAFSPHRALANMGGPHGGAVDWACTNMHFWSAGPHLQIVQFDEWQDALGYPCERTNAVRTPTFTSVHFDLGTASYNFRLPMPVWQIGFSIFLIVAGAWALFIFGRKARRAHS
jgi:hypothetical protein